MNHNFFWLRGVAVFAAAMALMLTAGLLLQRQFGMYGVLFNQLLLLAVSIAGVIVLKLDFKEVFPVKVPRVRQIIGVIIMVPAGMLVSAITIYPALVLFPQSIEVVESISRLFQTVPGLTGWMIVAIAPAICEEALHRGVIRHTFERSGFKSKWIIIFCMGFIFGIFHLDPVRFFPTAILGMIITYITLESQNILLAVLYHFINNTLSFSASSLTPANGTEVAEAMGLMSEMVLPFMIAVAMLSGIGLLILRFGAGLIKLPQTQSPL